MEQKIFVFIDLFGEQYLVGQLWLRDRKGRESSSFEYDPSWLKNSLRFAIDPTLTVNSRDIPYITKKRPVWCI